MNISLFQQNEVSPRRAFHLMISLGLLWGLVEGALGGYLKPVCYSSGTTGSVLTGFSFLFMACAYAIQPKLKGLLTVLGLCVVMKLAAALILGIDIIHGAVINPIYAFITEAGAFFFAVSIIDRSLLGTVRGGAFAGIVSAVVAAGLFAYVGHFTTIPACTMSGSDYPLSLYWMHIAAAVACVTVPVGFRVGAALRASGVAPVRLRIPAFVAVDSIALIVFLAINISKVR